MTLGELVVRLDAVMLNYSLEILEKKQGILAMKVAFSKEEADEINKGFREIDMDRKKLIKTYEDCT